MVVSRNVQQRLLKWFKAHRRDLPWRKTKDPYRILVSEVMLQQTQVSRVVPKYEEFIRRFPSLSALARAQQRSVVTAWSGLGYNRRARNLHQLAKFVMKHNAGKLPQTPGELRQLPGIGEYTAAAVACFAFGAPVAIVDVNVRRVLGRIFHGVGGPQKLSNEKVWLLAASLVPEKRAVVWNSMLMDFGATVCTQRSPLCAVCPVRTSCRAYPAVLQHQSASLKLPARFVGSDRYWRGKIVEFLRAQPSQRSPLPTLQRVFHEFGLRGEHFTRLVSSLTRDHLVAMRGQTVHL